MEVLLEIILQVVGEFLLPLVGELFFEALFQRLDREWWYRKMRNAATAILLYFVLGLIIGLISLLFFPNSFIRASRLHGISLIISPVLAGLTMAGIGWIRKKQGRAVLQLDTFTFGFVFAFALALVRFLLAG